MEEPVFEMDTKQGPCLPDFLIKAKRKGEVRTWVVEVMGFEQPEYLAGKEVTHKRMEELGPVTLMDWKRFESGLTSAGRKVTEQIRSALTSPRSAVGNPIRTDHRETVAGDAATVKVVGRSAPVYGALGDRETEVDDLLLAVHPDGRASPGPYA